MTTATARFHTNPTEVLFMSALMVSLGTLNSLLMYFKGPYFLAMEGMSANASIATTYAGLIVGIGLSVWFGYRPHRLSVCLMVVTTVAGLIGLWFLTGSLLKA